MLSERLRQIEQKVKDLFEYVGEECEALNRALDTAKLAWPDHQVVKIDSWKSRKKVPPAGQVWASDGTRVWLIRTDGNPIPEHASAVKFWTEAFIPAPPLGPIIEHRQELPAK